MKKAEKSIHIKGARVNNLKNIEVSIERNKLTVITGLSGSGKSSLAFDTLYAEGQRRYVESLSSYARQFLGRLNKPDVDFINGIPPAIAIEQKVNTRNPRSTVGTSTEIYDYIKLLYARVGKTISPKSGKEVKKHRPGDVAKAVAELPAGSTVYLLAPMLVKAGRTFEEHIDILSQQGFNRLMLDNEVYKIDQLIKDSQKLNKAKNIEIVVDRFKARDSEELRSRVADSAETAFFEGNGSCSMLIEQEGKKSRKSFSNRFEADGIVFEEPNVHMFSFNSPMGACPACEGFGYVIGIDEDLVVPDKSLSVYENAVACWRGDKMSKWKEKLIYNADKFDFPIHRPYYQLSEDEKTTLWNGNKYFRGIHQFFQYLETKSYKIQYRVMKSRYRGRTKCPDCKGTRLRKDASYVKIGGRSVDQLVNEPIEKLIPFFAKLKLNKTEEKMSKRLLEEINNRLAYLHNVGLGYLSLNRQSSTLSGGESQRINLAAQLGSSLVGSAYILDEPSIGLHNRDNNLLIGVLKHLRDIGNTVVVVEHDEEIIRAADQIIDIGPEAGKLGGEVVCQGTLKKLMANPESLTTQYLSGKREVPLPKQRRKWTDSIIIKKALENNLKGIDVAFPLNVMTVVTGVSGSGKSSLVTTILYPALKKIFGGYGERVGNHAALEGDIKRIDDVEMVDQNPIGRSSRSNPVTYIKAYDEIRKLYAQQHLAKNNGLKPAHFSFNVDGGRCEVCQGEGTVTVEMQFMADVKLVCEECGGKRFKEEVLEVEYRGKDINDILDMDVDSAVDFFAEKAKETLEKKIVKKLKLLQQVGLGYVSLGQSSSILSGGESQRIKLASFLGREKADERMMFIFDEPTTGLHFHDINKLMDALNALIDRGHTVLIIEHNMEVIKSADWIIDLGPDGGEHGGHLVAQGTPEDIVQNKDSHTASYLTEKLK